MKPQKDEVFARVIEILDKVIGNIDVDKFAEWLENSTSYGGIEERGEEFNPWDVRYLIFEDSNMSEDIRNSEYYTGHFFPNGNLSKWWMWFIKADGTDPDEDEDVYDCYHGIIDLNEGKYFRMNGHRDRYDYDPSNLKKGDPTWEDWRLK
ncbi:MAG TPA: hypothetical protein PK563_11890 [Tenuifilaceae bacterium]|nr:hypothetical protein [Tenuifilaceae bacterium]